MKRLFLAAILFISFATKAQHAKVPDTAGYHVIEQNKTTFPKFYHLFHQLLENEPLLKHVAFINKKGKDLVSPTRTVLLS